MAAEIKNLDSDMQMLVYENYNKFISATDTIRTMKSNVDNMDGSMQTLQQVMGNLITKFCSSATQCFSYYLQSATQHGTDSEKSD